MGSEPRRELTAAEQAETWHAATLSVLADLKAARGEADALREALRQIMFAGCRHVWDDECARCHTFEPLKDIARAALGPSEAPTEGQGDADT